MHYFEYQQKKFMQKYVQEYIAHLLQQ